jgi:hypothetical protein
MQVSILCEPGGGMSGLISLSNDFRITKSGNPLYRVSAQPFILIIIGCVQDLTLDSIHSQVLQTNQ